MRSAPEYKHIDDQQWPQIMGTWVLGADINNPSEGYTREPFNEFVVKVQDMSWRGASS